MKRTFALLVLAAIAATTGCGGDSDDSSAAKPSEVRGAVLKISDTSTPGDWSFDTKRLTAKPGKVTIELHNASGLGHNVRVHTGKCCFKPGYKDLGGTEVIGRDQLRQARHRQGDTQPRARDLHVPLLNPRSLPDGSARNAGRELS